MKASTMYYDSYDSDTSSYQTIYIFSSILGCAFWCGVIYCCVRGCRSVAETPQVVQVTRNDQQPQIHYIVHQDAMGPDGNSLPAVGADGQPIMYQQIQPGQFVPVPGYQPPTAAAPMATEYTPAKAIESQSVV